MQIKRLPRKIKKKLKKLYFNRYGIKFLKCDNLLIEYNWFFKNGYNFNMNKQIYKIKT